MAPVVDADTDFDRMLTHFEFACRRAITWKSYFGAAYSSRVRLAIADLKLAIEEAEAHPEIGFVEPAKKGVP